MFATFFPTDTEDYEDLKTALVISLNDASLVFTDQRSNLLGSGFRCGFLDYYIWRLSRKAGERI